MISLSKSGNTVTFTFDENSGYLQNGAIDVPVNSLSLIIDESAMVTFRKSASNDIFVSANIAEFGMSKSDLEAWYKQNMVGATGGGGGGGDITSGEVQTMIDASISGKADTTAVTESISAATDDMATKTWVGQQGYITGVDLSDYATLEDIPDVENYFDGAEYDSGTTRINFYHGNTVKAYIDASAFIVDGMIDDVRIETLSGASYLVIDFNTASGKADILIPLTDIFDPSNYYDKTEVDAALSGKADTSAVTQEISAAVSGKADTSAVTAVDNVLTAHTADTTIHVTSSDKTAWSGKQDALVSGTNIKTINNESILGSGNITISGGGSGNPTVELTQAEYDALVSGVTVDPTTYYIITDATPIDISNYYTSAQTNSAINAAVSGKVDTSAITSSVTSASTNAQIPTAKAVYDAIPTGGTSSSYSAGTNISIDTANTISCTLPITKPTNINYSSSIIIPNDNNRGYCNSNYCVVEGYKGGIDGTATCSHKEGDSCAVESYAIASHVEGYYCRVKMGSKYSHAEGYYTETKNESEHASGRYNVSSSGSSTFGDSGNTLFSVGNGTADNARHNAFEIRQNGDIYCNNGTSDVKLQDYIQFKIVQITQAAYDALVSGGTVDSSTVYLITNVVS